MRALKIKLNPPIDGKIISKFGSDLNDALNTALTRVGFRNTQNLAVVMPHVVHIKHTDRSCLNQASGKRGFSHDDHGVERGTIFSEGVGDESVIERIAHRRMENTVEGHDSRILEVFVFVSAPRRNLNDQIDQPWRGRWGKSPEVHDSPWR